MAVQTHDSSWRVLVAAAPMLGVAFMMLAAVQGEPEIFKSRNVYMMLAAFAGLGCIVAAWTAQRLRAAPTVAVAQAQPGLVALRGIARPLPGALPLLSPAGEACLWFKHGEYFAHHYGASDSVRPFLLVDDSGSCIVLPAGANITGSGRPGPPPSHPIGGPTDITGSRDLQSGERLLRDGESIHVVGRFVPVSAEAIACQQHAARLVEQIEWPSVTIRSNNRAEIERLRQSPPPMPPASPPITPITPIGLPVVTAPEGATPFVISIASSGGQAGLYLLLAVVDALLFATAGGAALWLA